MADYFRLHSYCYIVIKASKERYLKNMGAKLNDPLTTSKAYWSILKRFLNKVKIPLIPPILVNDVFITDFKDKSTLFNEYSFSAVWFGLHL